MAISLEQLTGTWYIHYTNFPMWLKGDKQFPTFNYALGTRDGKAGLTDVVRYTQAGKMKEIVGFDTPTDPDNTHFRWRGNGLLWLFASDWEIVHFDEYLHWALIYFSRTLATPAGYDVIARTPYLSDHQEVMIRAELSFRKLSNQLTRLIVP